MITDAILEVFYLFAWGVSRLVAGWGTVSANNTVTDAIVTARTYFAAMGDFWPLVSILALISITLVFEGAFVVYKLVRWGYQKIPGIN